MKVMAMQDGQGGSEYPSREHVPAWSPQPDSGPPEGSGESQADPGQSGGTEAGGTEAGIAGTGTGGQASALGAGHGESAAASDATLPGFRPLGPPDGPDAPDPGATWVPHPTDRPAPPGGTPAPPGGQRGWAAPGQGQTASGQEHDQAGAPGPWTAPGPAQDQPGSPWATPPGQGLAGGTPGPWATPPGRPAAGAWGILPGQSGQPGEPGEQHGQSPWPSQPGGYGPGGYPQPGGYTPGGYGSPGYAPPGGQGPWGPQPGGYEQPPPRRRGRRFFLYALVIVLAAAGGAGLAAALVPSPSSTSYSATQIPSPSSSSPGGTSTSSINEAAVASKVEPGVVDITSRLHYSGQVFEGTGMVLTSSGLVLTNNHVVAGTTHLTVRLVSNGRTYPATVVGTDATDDVALIKMAGASGLRTVQVGDSAKVVLGTQVVAIGNAGGQNGPPTVTQGSITALGRTITASDAGSGTSETLHGMLQTNAPIAEGDSGGPLSDAAGQVIGMDTAASTQSIGGPGTAMGFAIPINRALSIARQINSGHGSADIRIGLPAFMGIEVADVPTGSSGTPQAQLRILEQQASENGNAVNSSTACLRNGQQSPVPATIAPVTSGTLIAGAFCGDPAVAAGLKAGGVITAVDGHAVTTPATLTKIMSRYSPGDTVRITWTGPGDHQHISSLKLIGGPAK